MTLTDHRRCEHIELSGQLAATEDELREALDALECAQERIRDLGAAIGGMVHQADTWQQVAPCDQGKESGLLPTVTAAICRFVHAWMDGVWPDPIKTEQEKGE